MQVTPTELKVVKKVINSSLRYRGPVTFNQIAYGMKLPVNDLANAISDLVDRKILIQNSSITADDTYEANFKWRADIP